MAPQELAQTRALSKALQEAQLEKKSSNFVAYEPVSLPVSRISSYDAGSKPDSSRPSPRPSPRMIGVNSPPLTPAGSNSLDSKKDRAPAGRGSLTEGRLDPAIMTPQISSPRSTSEAPNVPAIGGIRPPGASAAPAVPDTRTPSTKSSYRSAFSAGPGSDSTPASREISPSDGHPSASGTTPPPSRPFTPLGNKDDPYARNKRPPQSRNLDAIDARFKFSGTDNRRGQEKTSSKCSLPRSRSSGPESKGQDDHRHSHFSLGSKREQQQDHGSSLGGKSHGSMTDLKRFLGLGSKHKRGQSPTPSTKSSRSGTRTPPHQLPQNLEPFADDHGLQTKYGKFGKVLGSGAGGSVRLMRRGTDGVTFAVKEFRARHSYESEKEYSKKVTAEFCVGSTLHHGNIIETLDIIHEDRKWYVVMEYAPFDLFAIVMTGKMSKEEVTCSFLQIVNGVTYLHSMGLAHRDLKLDNVVVNEFGIMKIIDFGSSTVFRYPFETDIVLAHGIVGSDPYLAPEVYDSAKYDPQPLDIWSLAIIYCCMTLRRFPWKLPRPTDNSFRLFASTPSPDAPVAPLAVRRTPDQRPKSTADLPGVVREGEDPSRQTSEGSKSSHHHHHRHQHHPKSADTEEPARSTTPETTIRPAENTSSSLIKGPWRLLRLLPRESRNIIAGMLELEPKRRATLGDVLRDEWVTTSPVCSQEVGGKMCRAEGHTHTLEAETTVAAQVGK
ncbi:MAG: serine/threonine protein kinase [Caeruleum heppii]|nr:MAG: serine/threonine protein kinase [Caeruleum heppii]